MASFSTGLGLLAATVALDAPAQAHGAARAADGLVKAQRALNRLGCDAGPADGVAGEHTRAAIIRFQSRHRLNQTASLNLATRKKLFSATAKRCDVRPVPGNSGQGRRVVISQRQNWVWLVNAGGRVVAQSAMIDNTKVLRPTSSKVGSYCGRNSRISRNTDGGNLWLYNFVRFAPCGIGFHRIPVSMSSGRQIHPDYLLGTNLRESHGCIRLPAGFSNRIWDFAQDGTRVRVISG